MRLTIDQFQALWVAHLGQFRMMMEHPCLSREIARIHMQQDGLRDATAPCSV
ncbi:hypothetical protein XOC_2421 [Xanthomonas oryzae pv. oryzicola BLS256]|uniref:Uncharacterized protein n=1 Tax=Xanthomonas oryzae pv. oryzicola (strain BLS256) TaxID=383407 RepID=G7TFJ7_XANOB|nr:hypothetical protein XOC_2421 [Xanthomonas oryzae pv. oryzicola BLS256]